MFKFLIFQSVSFFYFISSSCAQTVIGSSGVSLTKENFSLSWTIGEPITATFSSPEGILTNGFHQSNLLLTAIDDYDQQVSVKVFPNPTQDILSILVGEATKKYSAFLTSADGTILHTINFIDKAQLDLSGFPSGTYLLSLQSTDKILLKTFKVVKVK